VNRWIEIKGIAKAGWQASPLENKVQGIRIESEGKGGLE